MLHSWLTEIALWRRPLRLGERTHLGNINSLSHACSVFSWITELKLDERTWAKACLSREGMYRIVLQRIWKTSSREGRDQGGSITASEEVEGATTIGTLKEWEHLTSWEEWCELTTNRRQLGQTNKSCSSSQDAETAPGIDLEHEESWRVQLVLYRPRMTHAFLCLSRSIEDSSMLCKFCGCETHGSGCGDDRVDDCGKGCTWRYKRLGASTKIRRRSQRIGAGTNGRTPGAWKVTMLR